MAANVETHYYGPIKAKERQSDGGTRFVLAPDNAFTLSQALEKTSDVMLVGDYVLLDLTDLEIYRVGHGFVYRHAVRPVPRKAGCKETRLVPYMNEVTRFTAHISAIAIK